jgi:TRAP-type C4-dicarboxylate transport system permease small subunit
MEIMLQKFEAFLDLMVRIIISTQLMLMVVFCFLQTAMRYLFNNPLVWSEEITRFIFIWMVFIGSSLATSLKDHIRVDMFPKFMSRSKTGLNILQMVVSSLNSFLLVFLIVIGFKLVSYSIQVSPALFIPWKYVYLAIPVGAIGMLFYEVNFIVMAVLQLLGYDHLVRHTSAMKRTIAESHTVGP